MSTNIDITESHNCLLCCKSFASTMALANHAKNEHFTVYAQGDPEKWTGPSTQENIRNRELNKIQQILAETKVTKDVALSNIAPVPITTLADMNVGMLIMRKEDDDITPPLSKRVKKEVTEKTIIDTADSEHCCIDCDMYFMDKYTLKCHMRDIHNLISHDFICDVCGKSYKTKTYLEKHIIDHSNIKIHACPVCSDIFSTYDSLKEHYLEHKEMKCYYCDICKKLFSSKLDLDDHYKNAHSLTKPYHCDLCERTFSEAHSLKVHMNATHKKSTTYTCKFCSKIFHEAHVLTLHEKEHTGRREPRQNKHIKVKIPSRCAKRLSHC